MVLDTELQERVSAISQQKFLDDQPCVEGPCISLTVDPTLRLNYQDAKSFETHWVEETVAMGKLVRIDFLQPNNINMKFNVNVGGFIEIR